MMKRLIIVLLILLNATLVFAQNAKSYIHQGNKLYQQKKYKEAEEAYRKAAGKKEQKLESSFNLGDALYKEKQFDNAQKNFTNIASSTTNPLVKAGAYHNLGNSLLTNKKYQESVDAYKKSLLSNPHDDQTRYNLAYAQEMLKKQQQQNKNNQNNQNKNNQNNQNKSKSDQDKKNQDKQNPGKNDPGKNNQDKKDQQNQQQPDKVSKDDAQRMLDALNDQEKGTQDKLKNRKLKGEKTHIDKDW